MRGNSDRFFYNQDLGQEYLEVTDRDLIWQWKKVLRLKEGDGVRLFDGSGWEYEYKFSMINDQFSSDNIGPIHESAGRGSKKYGTIILKLVDKKFFKEPEEKLVLGFGLLKSRERMEWLVEKVTELGVDEMIPLVAQYSQVDRLRGKERLEKKIIEACEQCGRVRMPEIRANFQFSIFSSRDRTVAGNFQRIFNGQTNIVGADHDLPNYEDYLKVCFDGRGEKIDLENLKIKIAEKQDKVLLMVGPEGGWSEEEYNWFKENNFLVLSLGTNVLRAETAGVMGVGVMKLMTNNKE